uniref:Putative secreted protein n=1 Tax=Amblyomma triste TaxID=251400 RepID=A0A023FZN7_AMBTT
MLCGHVMVIWKYFFTDCDILMTRETVESRIPQPCGDVYLQHCTNYTGFSVELWKKNCSSDINIYEQWPAC